MKKLIIAAALALGAATPATAELNHLGCSFTMVRDGTKVGYNWRRLDTNLLLEYEVKRGSKTLRHDPGTGPRWASAADDGIFVIIYGPDPRYRIVSRNDAQYASKVGMYVTEAVMTLSGKPIGYGACAGE